MVWFAAKTDTSLPLRPHKAWISQIHIRQLLRTYEYIAERNSVLPCFHHKPEWAPQPNQTTIIIHFNSIQYSLFTCRINSPRLSYRDTTTYVHKVHKVHLEEPIAAAERSKARVFCRSLAGILGTNPAEGTDVCLLLVMCVGGERSLHRAHHESSGVQPTYQAWCVCVWSWSLDDMKALAH